MKNKVMDLLNSLRQRRLAAMLVLALAIFLVFSLAGYFSESAESQKVIAELEDFLRRLKGLSSLELAALIFLNNSLKAMFSILSGLLLGLGPLFFLTGNGFICGILIKEVAQERSVSFIILSLLPHGIIEFPVLIVSAALGFNLGLGVLLKLTRKSGSLKGEIKKTMAIFLVILLPALLVAAIAEIYVTPVLTGVR